MSGKDTYVIKLLRACRGVNGAGRPPRFGPRRLRHLVAAGLGPAAHDALAHSGRPPPEELLSADLSARVIYEQMKRATVALLEAAGRAGLEPVLLKGVSIADQLYRPPHHRLMADIDVLVRPEEAPRLASLLRSAGYAPGPAGTAPGMPHDHHHLPELRHPHSGISVEIHTALISRTLLAEDPLMQPRVFGGAIRPSELAGTPCRRFSLEYQIVYTLMHWAIDYKWPVNVNSINDFIHLVNSRNGKLDWRQVGAWMDQSPAFADLYAVLGLYLRDCGLIQVPEALTERLRAAARRIGAVNLAVLHWLLRKFPLSGRRKVGWVLTPLNARIIWLSLLEPRHKALRPFVALSRVLFRRTRGKSLLGSVPGRIRTLLQPNA